MLEDEDIYEDREEDDEEEDGDDEPSAVFVGMAFGRDGTEEAFGVIRGVCDRLGLDALRVGKGVTPGSAAGNAAASELLEEADFAILDFTHKRPTIAQELDLVDRELDPAFVLLIARAGTPPIPDLQGRAVNSYADKGDLRALIERHLNTMVDLWHEGDTDGEYDQ